ncbi:MAG: hypothetical protein N7Q72_06165 [Spiroplasma sp. Tabriz.8]|nr:hypothetical protein [Spiroplasma sp. Tabriz.8]
MKCFKIYIYIYIYIKEIYSLEVNASTFILIVHLKFFAWWF